MEPADLYMLLGAVALAIALVFVMRWRMRSHAAAHRQIADEVVCEHLRPAWELLAERGHRATRIGQRHPDLPMEIHTQPAFDPRALSEELNLTDPVFVSERNVLYCKEDWCEIHPTA